MVATAVSVAEVYTKYEIGRYIVADEQNGKYRAAYGKQVLKCLADRLKREYGNGWSEDTLGRCRKFFEIYSEPRISATPLRKFKSPIPNVHNFVLTWSHYLVLMRVENADARSFYEVECAKQNWSVRWLQMQMYVNYYDRYQKQNFENPTVGILLCKEKNDALVELTLPKESNVYAAQYELYLPNKKDLQARLRSWIEEFEDQNEENQ